jgi:hypothetical protein
MRQLLGEPTLKDSFGFFILEGPNHAGMITRSGYGVKMRRLWLIGFSSKLLPSDPFLKIIPLFKIVL